MHAVRMLDVNMSVRMTRLRDCEIEFHLLYKVKNVNPSARTPPLNLRTHSECQALSSFQNVHVAVSSC